MSFRGQAGILDACSKGPLQASGRSAVSSWNFARDSFIVEVFRALVGGGDEGRLIVVSWTAGKLDSWPSRQPP